MSDLHIGSLCSGYGGLDMAAVAVFGGRVTWHVEIDPDPSAALEHHWPDVPNLRDVKTADPEPVDILCEGVPCQPASAAGRRAGEDDPRWLWPYARRLHRMLRPRVIVFENVEGLVTLRGGEVWRSILEDFRTDGYAVRWLVMGACVVGACHHRHRVFALAAYVGPGAPPAVRLDVPKCGARDVLLPTPRASDGPNGGPNQGIASGDIALSSAVIGERFGRYAAAVQRWTDTCGVAPPEPTQTGPRGGVRLAPAFPEWMMGLAAGHVTGVPDLSRSAQLRMIGNGVMPAQGMEALRLLLRIV